jgi:hypothetical protein
MQPPSFAVAVAADEQELTSRRRRALGGVGLNFAERMRIV